MLDELYLNKIIYIHMYKSLRVKLLRKLTNLLGWCGGGSDGRGGEGGRVWNALSLKMRFLLQLMIAGSFLPLFV